MKPHLLDQEVIDMILRHATECIGTDGVDGLRGHILTLTALLAKIEAERDALKHTSGELYQVLGVLADQYNLLNHPDMLLAMDNASDNLQTHDDLLPWPKTPLPDYRAENARLREALRGMSITTILSVGDGHCLLCDGSWKPGEPEAHGPGCLAAPSQGEER